MQKNNQLTFEFGNNFKLRKSFFHWKNHKDYKGFVIVSPSGNGKTTFLKMVQAKLTETEIVFLNGYEFLEQIIYDIRNGSFYTSKTSSDFEHNALLVDHLDDIISCESAFEIVCCKLRNIENNKPQNTQLIICTFIDKNLAFAFAKKMNYELLSLREVKPNIRIVKKAAKMFDLNDLSFTETFSLLKSRTMFELRKNLQNHVK